jgi:dTDP-4-amino-4,6-dideoxygalactose transaminase
MLSLINSAVKKVIESGNFIGGEEVKNFEKEFAKFCKTKYAISVNSGTDALFLALKSLGIKEGDEVITTPFTFIATVEAIVNCGAKPVFVDIELDTFNIDASKAEKVITKKTKAILPVHLFGQLANMVEIMKIANKYKLFIVEDSAQSVGAEYNGKKTGIFGDLGCFSFFPSKNLGAMGDGGMVITNKKKLAEKIRLLKNHGSSFKDKYKNLLIGINSRLDTIQAAILRIKLRHLKKWNKKRKEIADYYSKNLREIKEVKIPVTKENGSHVFHQYTILAGKRNELKKYLENNNISAKIYYPLPLHLQPALKYLGYKKGSFPNAEKAAKEVLSLPIYPELPPKQQNFIIEKIREFYKR